MSAINVPIPTEQFLRVVDLLRKNGSMSDPVEMVEFAIDYWLDSAAWKAEDLIPDIPLSGADRGYMWKHLFLPHGCIVRMKYQGRFHYAKVEGDELVFDGQPISPQRVRQPRNWDFAECMALPLDQASHGPGLLLGGNATVGVSQPITAPAK